LRSAHLALAMAALVGGLAPAGPPLPSARRRLPHEDGTVTPGPELPEPCTTGTCPTCGATDGNPCDPRTLGRFPHHAARLANRTPAVRQPEAA